MQRLAASERPKGATAALQLLRGAKQHSCNSGACHPSTFPRCQAFSVHRTIGCLTTHQAQAFGLEPGLASSSPNGHRSAGSPSKYLLPLPFATDRAPARSNVPQDSATTHTHAGQAHAQAHSSHMPTPWLVSLGPRRGRPAVKSSRGVISVVHTWRHSSLAPLITVLK